MVEEEGETAQIAAFFAAFCSAVSGALLDRSDTAATGVEDADGFWAMREEELLDWIRRPSWVSSADRVET